MGSPMPMPRADPYGRLFDLTGRVALVTGGGRGIGRGAALALARQGADVALGYAAHPEAVEETRQTLEKMGRRSIVLQADVTDARAVDAMVEEAARRLGRLDIVVNNAGVAGSTPMVEMPDAEWDRVVDTNLKGEFLVARAAAREMIREGREGRIVNVASIASGGVGVGFPGATHYAASKGGIIGMTESMALEMAPHRITVNAVAPGVIDTDMTSSFLRDP